MFKLGIKRCADDGIFAIYVKVVVARLTFVTFVAFMNFVYEMFYHKSDICNLEFFLKNTAISIFC